MSSTKVQLRGISKVFHSHGVDVKALDRLDLTIAQEEFVALVGPSGCGKSTVLNMVAGLFEPSSGQVVYDDKPVEGMNHKVGYMTQKDLLLPWRNVNDNIGVALELKAHNVPSAERKRRVAEMVELVGLKGFEKHYPGELSGGMRKRVALARTLIYEPETLLMDEPFGALDAQLKLVMQEELLRIARLRKSTVIFVTHDIGEAIALAERVVVFSGRPGRVKAIKQVPLPRDRDVVNVRFEESFAALSKEIWDQLVDDVKAGEGAHVRG